MKNILAALFSLLAMTLAGCDSTTTPPADSGQAAQTQAPAAELMPVEAPPLIERTVLFGNPMRFQGRLSPDGTQMSFRAPLDGVMNLWVGARGDFANLRAITHDTGRGIPSHFWALDSKHVLYIQDQGGD
ncbi:MAG: S9 family peptidase, partial [Xanthomonadales bacterium]|nr:S9 family peptidase [Xanthomonadales bacterium]